MKKALVFFFAIAIGLSFTFTGFAQESTTSGPAKPPKKLAKGRYTQTKKKTPQASGAQAQTTTPAKPAAAKQQTAAKRAASTSSGAPVHEQNGKIGPGSAAGKKLSKGRYTKQGRNNPQ